MCQFNIELSGQVDEIKARAKLAIESNGGQFDPAGSFSFTKPARIKGTFTIAENLVKITITDKPFYVSCGKIESTLKDFEF